VGVKAGNDSLHTPVRFSKGVKRFPNRHSVKN
jgi:hypothetical protein